ncbi:hypothetical protein AC629_01945 [Bradyrhizobium sp. NAS80.1]|uniref:DUF6894 family protein n=1 Tax=Bradyrhizobium sp. NAS80.1 TaxID=1680159 RepID=UPI0009654F3A|nr:hypothetical protein [Bradyrhizobium sp. NAS80.1]OKO91732.1 hypothetical protein AC629_01945 [Bradyrhizobium sp. NAS80.1]
MTRYYFDLIDDDGLFIDEEGLELSDFRSVQVEAAKSLADMARDATYDPCSSSKRYMAIEVRDDAGPVMHVGLEFGDERRQ